MIVLGLLPANAVRNRMERGREALLAARTALLEGEPELADRRFGDAEEAFASARGWARSPLLRLASVVPILGRTPDAAVGLAEGAREVARAGATIADAVARLPRGLASLGPQNGRIPIESFETLAPALARASDHLARAETATRPIPRSWLLGPVAAARTQFDAELAPIRRGLQAAALLAERFPTFLGSDGPRRYLFVAENPAELRGTGGLIGSVAVMTIRDGRISFGRFEPNENFPRLPAAMVEPPNEDYARRYPQGAGFILVANLTPDFPSAAAALKGLYEASRRADLDGVIAADPFALQKMLEVSGPVTAPGFGEVTSENVIALVTNQAYGLAPSSPTRTRVLGAIAALVLHRFLQDAPAANAARAIFAAGGGGHITVYAEDPEIQRGFALAGASGALPDPGDDLVAPIVNNGGANKIDFFAERSVRYAVQLGAENSARADLELTIHNGAPLRGQHRYVIGPTEHARRGENVSLVSLYAPPDVSVLDFEQDGEPGGVGVDSELGHAVISSTARIPSDGTATMRYALGLPSAWRGTTAHGTYRLTYLGQTSTIPTKLRVDITAPAGTRIVHTSVPMQVDGNRAVWEGEGASTLVFEVEFQKPVLARAWDAVTGFFRKRVISF